VLNDDPTDVAFVNQVAQPLDDRLSFDFERLPVRGVWHVAPLRD
jgi:hypothetical protein